MNKRNVNENRKKDRIIFLFNKTFSKKSFKVLSTLYKTDKLFKWFAALLAKKYLIR